jgi:hypothetical protein
MPPGPAPRGIFFACNFAPEISGTASSPYQIGTNPLPEEYHLQKLIIALYSATYEAKTATVRNANSRNYNTT